MIKCLAKVLPAAIVPGQRSRRAGRVAPVPQCRHDPSPGKCPGAPGLEVTCDAPHSPRVLAPLWQ